MVRTSWLLILFCICLLSQPVSAQFTTIINIPPDPNIGDDQSIGSDTQINLANSGAIGKSFEAGAHDGTSTNIEINISGGSIDSNFHIFNQSTVNLSNGSIGNGFRAYPESTVNISGGRVGNSLEAFNASTVNISGGSFGDTFEANSGSTINVSGGEFRLDGESIPGLNTIGDTVSVNLPVLSELTGTLADGTPFALFNRDPLIAVTRQKDRIDDGVITLKLSALPSIGPANIQIPADPVPLGIRAGQTLTVNTGGSLPDDLNAGRNSAVIINGGNIGENFEAVKTQVTISDGVIGKYFDAFDETIVDISGSAIIDDSFTAHRGSTANIFNGSVGFDFHAYQDTSINLFDGSIGSFSHFREGSVLNMQGGSLGYTPRAHSGSTLNISDGTVGRFFNAYSDSIINFSGGEIGNDFDTDRNTLVNISGGTIGNRFESYYSAINISGGTIGENFFAYGGTLKITGGSIGNNFLVNNIDSAQISNATIGDDALLIASKMNFTGGSIGDNFSLFGLENETVFSISSGTVGNSFSADNNCTANISGGSFGDGFAASLGTDINIFGTQFFLDSIDITTMLTTNIPFEITDRDVPLIGLLADGSTFDFDLNSIDIAGQDYFHPRANLTITLVEPGDFNGSLDVDGTDFLRWQRGLPDPLDPVDYANWQQNFGHHSDFDNDGDTDGHDFLRWQQLFGAGYNSANLDDWQANFGGASPAITATVPEPTTFLLMLLGFALSLHRPSSWNS